MKKQSLDFSMTSSIILFTLSSLLYTGFTMPPTPLPDVESRDSLVVEYLFSGNAKDSGPQAMHGQVHGAKWSFSEIHMKLCGQVHTFHTFFQVLFGEPPVKRSGRAVVSFLKAQ